MRLRRTVFKYLDKAKIIVTFHVEVCSVIGGMI